MMPPYPTTSRPSLATMYMRLRSSLISDRKRLGLHGRGYTWRSMAMTPFRWRRRMRVTSSSTGSSTAIPGDLRIRFPHVERLDVVQPVEILPLQARNRQLDQAGGAGVGVGRRGELDVVPRRFQLLPLGHAPLPHHQERHA